ncbi:MAG: GAF domain-containing protein [Anaerolineae bacterium]|nr:GAF domain-containing protein [Anaerolineae bacterium]
MTSFIERLNPRRVPPTIDPNNSLLVLRERGLQYIFLLASGLGVIAFIQALSIFVPRRAWALLAIYGTALAIVLSLTVLRTLNFRLRAYLVLALIYVLGVTGLVESGLSGSGKVFLVAFAALSAILLGVIPGITGFGLSLVTYGMIGWLMIAGVIPVPPVSVLASSGRPNEWLNDGLLFGLLLMMVITTVNALTSGIESAIQKQSALSEELRKERDSLEDRVKERTAEAERRIAQIEAAADLARDISTNIELENLLRNAVELIRERFGFYHAGIFLVDERGEYAVLRAATGEAGRAMLANNHRLKVGEVGIVGYVVSKGEPRVTLKVEEDAFHFKNPLLPETQSEMALPLRVGEKVIGALDVQSRNAYAFNPDDVKIIQTLADQIAVAIEKARLVQQLQESLRSLEASAVQLSRQSWLDYLKNVRKGYAYRYQQETIEEINPSNETATPFNQTQIEIMQTEEGDKDFTKVGLPIKLRGHVLGMLEIKLEGKVVAPGTIKMLEAIADRLSTALDNARLLEEIRFRSEREHLVSEIATQMRSRTEVEDILRTAALEIGRKMGIAEVVVQLRND